MTTDRQQMSVHLREALDGWDKVPPLMVGSGYNMREYCDGQTLASPGRWPVDSRRYPEDVVWKKVSEMVMDFSATFGTVELLMNLAAGRVNEPPFPKDAIDSLRRHITCHLEKSGFPLERHVSN